MKKRLFTFAQFAIGIALLAVLFATMKDRSNLVSAIREAWTNWPFLLAGVMLFAVSICFSGYRWHILMHAQGIKLPIRRTLLLFFIGQFFNSFLIGATGGDLVKAFYVTKETDHKKTEAISTVFLDRIMGLLGLLILINIVMVWRLKFFLSYRETRLALAFFSAVTIAAVGGLIVVFGQNLFERWSFFVRLEKNTAFGSILSRVYSAFQVGFKHPGVFLKSIILSVLNHFNLVCMSAILGYALGIRLPFSDYLTTILMINAIAAIPLTPGGLGSRDTAAKFLLGVLGVQASRAVLLSLVLYGTMMSWSLVGGIVYLVYACRSGRYTGIDDQEVNLPPA